jgi:hypothetical protein
MGDGGMTYEMAYLHMVRWSDAELQSALEGVDEEMCRDPRQWPWIEALRAEARIRREKRRAA